MTLPGVLGNITTLKDKGHLGKYAHKNGPWRLLGYETFESRSDAMRREKQLKSWKSPKIDP